jgi:lysophospholipase L1-like esterase
MTRTRTTALAGSLAVAAAPLAILQALLVKSRAPRLCSPRGPDHGVVGRAPTLRLLVVGDSSAAAVGASSHARGLAGRLAADLAACTGAGIEWSAIGEAGLGAAAVGARLLPRAAGFEPDLVVLALGANDVLAYRSPRRWRAELADLIALTREVTGASLVVVVGIPALGSFTVLPRPLRAVLGERAAALNRVAADFIAPWSGVLHVPLPVELFDAAAFAADRFHPSEQGYRRAASHIAGMLVEDDQFATAMGGHTVESSAVTVGRPR